MPVKTDFAELHTDNQPHWRRDLHETTRNSGLRPHRNLWHVAERLRALWAATKVVEGIGRTGVVA